MTINSNSLNANMMIPNKVDKPPWMTGTNMCSMQETIRSSRVPSEVKKARTTCAVNSTPMPTAVIRVTAEIGFNFTPTNPIKPANSIVIETTTIATIAATHGLKTINEITTNTAKIKFLILWN